MNDNDFPTSDVAIYVHAPVDFDFTEGQPTPAVFGKSEPDVTVLTPLLADFSQAVEVPFLKLTLHLRPEADPGNLSLDVLRLIDFISAYERELGGSGMFWDAMRSRAVAGSGVVR